MLLFNRQSHNNGLMGSFSLIYYIDSLFLYHLYFFCYIVSFIQYTLQINSLVPVNTWNNSSCKSIHNDKHIFRDETHDNIFEV